jgi:hypothetical protein
MVRTAGLASGRGVEEQSHRVSETATAMEEMNATVFEVAKNASQAAETSDNARKKAQEGAEIVGQVVKGIGEVERQARDLKQDMEVLGKQAEGIGQVMNVISDIADQTNLRRLTRPSPRPQSSSRPPARRSTAPSSRWRPYRAKPPRPWGRPPRPCPNWPSKARCCRR